MSRRYRAPQKNGEYLIDPPFDAVPRLIEENRKKLDRDDVRIGGLTLRELRIGARQTNFSSSLQSGPLIVTGHQPELFHAGVWVKNFAAAGLAKRVNGHAVHITVDNDAMRSAGLAVPHFDPDPSRVHLTQVPFDAGGPEVAYEKRCVLDPALHESFPDRLHAEFSNWPFRPVLGEVWPNGAGNKRVYERLITVRYPIEAELQCIQWTTVISEVIRSESWLAFTRQLLADAPRFAAVHNAALAAYRNENKLRSRTHPFPDLAPNEVPFWVLDEAGKRTRCFVPFAGDSKTLRPRALTLTLFARLILGDFFIHGIGGGKYDEVTDRIIRDYFGIDPPAYQVVSGTLHLPFPAFPHSAGDVKRLERLRRDLDWNPQRHLTAIQQGRPEVAGLLAKRDALFRTEPTNRDERRQHFHDRRAVVEALRPYVAGRAAELERQLVTARTEAHANEILFRRDYAWVLYPRDVLIPFLKNVQDLAYGEPAVEIIPPR
jgi:hypothetical protein